MKRIQKLSILMLIAFFVLSFATRNNFNPAGKDWLGLESEKMVKYQEIIDLVNTRISTPIRECYVEVFPHAFMMKCRTDIVFSSESDAYNTDHSLEVYADYPVQGELVFIECESRHHLCDVQVTHSTGEIKVQESYFSPWISDQEYTQSFCEKIKTKKED